MIVNDIIESILKSNSIVDYLSNRGIDPVRHIGDKYVYSSPLPQVKGNDSTPSFFVYDKEGYQDFFCYSSKIGGNIITLHSHLNNKKFIESLKDFHDFDNVDDVVLQIAIDKISEAMSLSQDEFDFDCEFLKLSLTIRNYIKTLTEKCELDSDLGGIWEKMEHIILSEDSGDLEDLNLEVLLRYGQRQ